MELVKIVFNDNLNVNSVDARELHSVLEVGTEFSHWIKKRIVDTMAEENVDFSVVKKNVPGKFGKLQELIVIVLSLNLAKEIAMLERNEIGRKVRKYFIQCESELKAQPRTVERQKGDELSIADKMLKAVACAQREALEGKTDHTGYCVQISRRINELALGQHETGVRQKLTTEQASAINKVTLDVVKEAMKGNLNPSNVAKTLGAKYLEEAKNKTVLIKNRR
jgi:phage anti-repressor protein